MSQTLTLRDVLQRAQSRTSPHPLPLALPVREAVVSYLNETFAGPFTPERWNLAVETVFRVRSQFGVSVLAFHDTTIRFS